MKMSLARSKSRGDPVDASEWILVCKLKTVDALLQEHVVDRPSICLGALARLGANQPNTNVLVRAAPVGHRLMVLDLIDPPVDGLPRLYHLAVVIAVVVVVAGHPTHRALVPDARVDATPALPVRGNVERVDHMVVWIIVHEDLPDEDLMGAEDETVVPVLGKAFELLQIVLGQIGVIKRRSFHALIQLLPF